MYLMSQNLNNDQDRQRELHQRLMSKIAFKIGVNEIRALEMEALLEMQNEGGTERPPQVQE